MFDSSWCFLVGPVTPATHADWQHPQAIAFGPRDSWADVSARWPLGQTPAFVLVDLAYTAVPPWVWEVPLPRVLLVTDWDLQGTLTRLAARHAARVFTDPQGVRALQRAGIAHAENVHRFGLMGDFARLPPLDPTAPRDIDVLFVGNFNPAVQGERLPWLARLARLSQRYRIHFTSNAWGPAYRALLGRAKVVFNRALKGEINQRVAEAAWGGAALFQEADNPALADWGQPGVHYQAYDADPFETALDAFLRDEPRRQRLARSAWERTQALSWAVQRDALLARLLEEREALRQAQAARPVPTSEQRLLLRVWVALSAREQTDESLIADLERSAPDYAGLALAALRRDDPALAARRLHAQASRHPESWLPALGLVEQLLALGQTDLARQGALRLLRHLHTTAARTEGFPASEEEWPLSDPSFGPWRVGWERLGWRLAHEDHARRLARREWLRGRLESLLASLTGDLTHYYEAARAWPGEPGREAALGCALARAGHLEQALGHLQAERERYPFDTAAARALMQAYRDAQLLPEAEALAHEQALLHRAAPELVPAEPWFAPAPREPTGAGAEGVIRWEGPFTTTTSLAHVNRQLVRALRRRGWKVPIQEVPHVGTPLPPGPERDDVEAWQREVAPETPPETPPEMPTWVVRHAWPADAEPPAEGYWIWMQPWEYGALPQAWLPLLEQVDRLVVPSRFVAEVFQAARPTFERTSVVPLGVDPAVFHPGAVPEVLPGSLLGSQGSHPPFRFLFVGGTIARKGFDVLLEAYGKAFGADDPVCLVIKDHGAKSFYADHNGVALLERWRQEPGRPEVVYLDAEDWDAHRLAGLYTACDALVLPYRGEGFGLPLLEALACGLPVLTTAGGASDDFIDEAVGWRVPATRQKLAEARIGGWPTTEPAWYWEPDLEAWVTTLRAVAGQPEEARRRGAAGAERARAHFTWDHAAERLEGVLRQVRTQPLQREKGRREKEGRERGERKRRETVSLCVIARNEEANIEACLRSALGVVDEMVVLDTGSSDRTVELAQGCGARVAHFPWCDDFAAARNAVLEAAQGPWIFWLDADDRLDATNRERLHELLRDLPETNVAFSMKCRCVPDGTGAGATLVDHVRLFRKGPGVRWRYRVHEQILPALRESGATVRFAPVVIDHVGYVDAALRGRKLQRDLRLLRLQHEQMGPEPFTLFNLGATLLELGQEAEALALLEGSLARSHPADSIVRKLHALIASCQLRLGQPAQALEACLRGLRDCPEDAELLLLEGTLRSQSGDPHGARAALLRLLHPGEVPAHFASVAEGLRGERAYHQLGVVAEQLGETDQAEGWYRQALARNGQWRPSWSALAGLWARTGRWEQVQEAIAALETMASAQAEAAWWRGRCALARGDLTRAREVLEDACARWPEDTALTRLRDEVGRLTREQEG